MRTDAELLRSYDPEAFGEFYERHVGAVTAYLGRRTRQPDVLFDLLGETFARAYEHRRQHEPRKGPAIAWLLSTARYVVADAERRGQVPDTARKRIGMEPFPLGEAALATITERGRTDLAEALAGLPESQRIAVYRRVLGDDEYAPAPAQIGVSALVTRDPETRKARDPFELLEERLFVAAGGRWRLPQHAARRGDRPGHAVRRGPRRRGAAPVRRRPSAEPDPHADTDETPTGAPPDPTATATPRRPQLPVPSPALAASRARSRCRTRAGRRPRHRPRSTSSSSRTCAPGGSAGAWTCRSRPGASPAAIAAAPPPARRARW